MTFAMTRRGVLAHAAAGAAVLTLPGVAARADDNPMPPELRKAIERDGNAPVLGNPDGDITLTEFFDYNCGFCRKMVKTVHSLIQDDKQLRVVFREMPVFGPGSDFAARASLASLKQGKYWQYHVAMMGMRGRAEQASVLATARKVGLDVDRLQKDMDAPEVGDHIARTLELADHMGLIGTPTFIAGNEGVFGQQSDADLRAMIARGRKALA